MENKVIFEGIILNQPKLTDFGSTLLRVKNTRTFTKKDGIKGETTYTAIVSVEWRKLAEEVVERFHQNDLIRIEGELKKKNTKKVDQNGDEIYETWIKALSVNALANMQSVIDPAIPKKPLEERMGYNPNKYSSTDCIQVKNDKGEIKEFLSVAKNQPTPINKKPNLNAPSAQSYQQSVNDEDPFGDRLPW